MPSQLEELAQWYLNKSFSAYKNTHKNSEKLLMVPLE
jgi:hypothetical protein